MPRIASTSDLHLLHQQLQNERSKVRTTITICAGTGCQASRSLAVMDALKSELNQNGQAQTTHIRPTGCHGFCEQGPIMVIDPGSIFYCRITPQDVPEIISKTVARGEIIDRLLYTDPVSGKKVSSEADVPFYRAQDRRLLAMNRRVDPCSIEDYIAIGGYSALAQTIGKVEPDKIIKEIMASGLRGRGGGGFPTGRKWEECRSAAGDEKYVICNADEGDPGAYMDRCVLEGNPHLVIEGMMIGAFAIGAQKGYIYVRNEYPLAVKHARIAVEQAYQYGVLGENILGTSFSFDVEVARGGGAFVCGESTALMASVEGRVGEPRPKDVHTVVEG
ncbi:MAG TPA: NAD(P)H-dependent oxidoreductase subunit E, partial [Syntrophobacteraceae bacterium]|nr:NAD(P)H-dependent oxidoreductase subunit E [Syntrophobacteraceae bacterium]